MADNGSSYVPAELTGEHYRPIGGSYDSLEKAMQAMEQHFRNKHGGAGFFQVFRPEDARATVARYRGGLDEQRSDGHPGDVQDSRAALARVKYAESERGRARWTCAAPEFRRSGPASARLPDVPGGFASLRRRRDEPDELEPALVALGQCREFFVSHRKPGHFPDELKTVGLFPDSGGHHFNRIRHCSLLFGPKATELLDCFRG